MSEKDVREQVASHEAFLTRSNLSIAQDLLICTKQLNEQAAKREMPLYASAPLHRIALVKQSLREEIERLKTQRVNTQSGVALVPVGFCKTNPEDSGRFEIAQGFCSFSDGKLYDAKLYGEHSLDQENIAACDGLVQ